MYFWPDGGKPTLCNINSAPEPPLMKIQNVLYFKKNSGFQSRAREIGPGRSYPFNVPGRSGPPRSSSPRGSPGRSSSLRSSPPRSSSPRINPPRSSLPRSTSLRSSPPSSSPPRSSPPSSTSPRLRFELDEKRRHEASLRFTSLRFATIWTRRGGRQRLVLSLFLPATQFQTAVGRQASGFLFFLRQL